MKANRQLSKTIMLKRVLPVLALVFYQAVVLNSASAQDRPAQAAAPREDLADNALIDEVLGEVMAEIVGPSTKGTEESVGKSSAGTSSADSRAASLFLWCEIINSPGIFACWASCKVAGHPKSYCIPYCKWRVCVDYQICMGGDTSICEKWINQAGNVN